ncbi:MAG: hypothetical protein H0V43_00465, partial [Gemmatimonadales bacterium]|nr:hypothetical protein [Gemmatimonadales bacterium]
SVAHPVSLAALGVRCTFLLIAAVPAHAQGTASPLPGYSASQLHCTRWAESSESQIETVTDRASSQAAAGREGRWSFRAGDTTGGVALEGWYDSLSVWRRSGNGSLAPDTDGVIGGRYRGLLGPRGAYAVGARPFIPDELAEVAELGGALDDFFPPLPPRRLAPGERWRGAETDIRRLADTVVAGRALLRFALEARRERSQTVPRGDTVPIPIRQSITERGEFTWNPSTGLAGRTRDIVVETAISAAGRIRQPVRSRVTQHIEIARLPGSACR